MPRSVKLPTHDAAGKQVGFKVIDLPDDHSGRQPWPSPQASDSIFDTEAEANEELKARMRGKKPCECGCGYYPRGEDSHFLPGHDLRKAYRDNPSSLKANPKKIKKGSVE